MAMDFWNLVKVHFMAYTPLLDMPNIFVQKILGFSSFTIYMYANFSIFSKVRQRRGTTLMNCYCDMKYAKWRVHL